MRSHVNLDAVLTVGQFREKILEKIQFEKRRLIVKNFLHSRSVLLRFDHFLLIISRMERQMSVSDFSNIQND